MMNETLAAALAAASLFNQSAQRVFPASDELRPLLAQVPALSQDARGVADSPVNLLILGSEPAVRAAFDSARWGDGAKLQAVRVLPESFPPVSDEFLFGRRQDMSYVVDVRRLLSRHHFRLWRAPFAGPGGEAVWVGTANYDARPSVGWGGADTCGYAGLFHRIDPDIDKERDYVMVSLLPTGRMRDFRWLAQPRAVREGKDSKCSPYHTDGRVLVIRLNG